MLAVVAWALLVSPAARAATFTVTNTSDGFNIAGSLRQAIQDANLNPGADIIDFAIPVQGVPTIAFVGNSTLVSVTDALTIDGTTQAGGGMVEVTRTAGLWTLSLLNADHCVVRGLIINGARTALRLDHSSDTIIEGNYIGTDSRGTADTGTDTGIEIFESDRVRIGGTSAAARNVISGNDTGIFFSNIMPRDNVIEGNYIGTDPSGTMAVPNGVGVDVLRATGTRIGGTAPGARNVIAGNYNTGVKIEFMGTGTVVEGNFIGVDANGAPLPNAFHGVELVNAAANTIGPDNVISYKGGDPIKKLTLKSGKIISATVKGLDLQPFLQVDPTPLTFVLQLGGRQYCITFAESKRFVAGKKLVAKKSPTAFCP